MSEKYTGTAQDRRYTGEEVDITYSARRCIHAEECVKRLATVFNLEKRPWINPDGDSGAKILDVIEHCPSGALHLDGKESGLAEDTPERNVITIWHNGPLQVRGDLSIHGSNVELEGEIRATLCRCGQSANKPFCDNSHKEAFTAVEIAPIEGKTEPQTEGGVLKISPSTDGPIEIEGNFEIHDAEGTILFSGSKTWLCRCGHSSRKPFCDQTHRKVGFKAE